MQKTMTASHNETLHDKLNSRVDDVTTSVGQTAQATADRVRDGDLTARTADGLESVGDYLQAADYDRLVEDLTSVVKRHPVPAILAGVGLGFLIGRLSS